MVEEQFKYSLEIKKILVLIYPPLLELIYHFIHLTIHNIL